MANRTCLLCGTGYDYCPTCAADKRKPSWMSAFDKEDCKIVFETLSAYGMNKISTLEARKSIKNIDTNAMNLKDTQKDVIKEILGNKVSVINIVTEEVVEEPVTEMPDIKPIEEANETVTNDNTEDVTENVYIPNKKRNRDYREEISE